jgi:hypothetical protein
MYRHPGEYIYRSPRYGKTVTVVDGYESDGATGADDLWSESWWVHDVLCERGTWDDGTPATNWQASRVLADILLAEGRYVRAYPWLLATLIFGGGKCRDNGIFRMIKEPR